MTSTMYKKYIMELYSEKPHFGRLKNPTRTIKQKNPVCNDEIIIDLNIDKKTKKIIDAKFSGKICFISTIAASALLENIIGKTIREIKNLTQKDIDKFLGINIIPSRIKCEMMALEALKKIND